MTRPANLNGKGYYKIGVTRAGDMIKHEEYADTQRQAETARARLSKVYPKHKIRVAAQPVGYRIRVYKSMANLYQPGRGPAR